MVEHRSDAHRDPVHRLWRVLHHDRVATFVANGKEPCAGCGEETAAGSVFFSDRRETTRAGGERVFLCSDCQARAHAARVGRPLTDEDLRTIAENGLMMGAGFWGGGH